MPSLVSPSHLSSALSAFKAKLRTCKDNVATFRTRSSSSSSEKRKSVDGERRHVHGLGYIQADVAPRRRGAAAQAKHGSKATRNQIAQPSEITTIGGFAYDRVDADDMGVQTSRCSIARCR